MNPANPFVWGYEVNSLPPLRWLIDGVLPLGDIGMVYGKTQNCKSFLVRDMACHIAQGRDWCGHPTASGFVLYVTAESQESSLRHFYLWNRYHHTQTDRICFYKYPVALTDDESVDAFLDSIDGEFPQPPVLIVFDTYHKCMAGKNEDSAGDASSAFNNMERIKDVYGCTVLLIHHPGRGGKHPRGSSAIDADVDFLYSVRYNEDARLITMEKEKLRTDLGEPYQTLTTELFRCEDETTLILHPAHGAVDPATGAGEPTWQELLSEAKRDEPWSAAEAMEITGLSKSALYRKLTEDFVEKLPGGFYRLR